MTESVVQDEVLRAKIREVLARPDYVLDPVASDDETLRWWLWMIELLLTPIRWLFGLTAGLPEVLRWLIVICLSLLLLGLLWHILSSLFSALRGSSSREVLAFAVNLTSGPDAELLERLAEEAGQRGEWIEAVRLLMRASVARLEQRERRTYRRGTTNREHLRRYRGSEIHSPLEVLVRAIEWKWYGEEPCEREDFDACQRAYQELVTLMSGRKHAYRA